MKHESYGSVEGILHVWLQPPFYVVSSSVKGNNKTYCLADYDLSEEMYKAIGKRVLISGKIRYGESGHPECIEVERFKVFKPQSELPTFEDVCGILKGKQDDTDKT